MSNVYLNLFSPETWAVFEKGGHALAGFPESRQGWAERVHPGDIFACYLTGESRFVGLVEVASVAWTDRHDVGFGAGRFPVRFRTRPLVILTPERSIAAIDLLSTLDEYRNLSSKNRWSALIRGSLKRYSNEDGRRVVDAIQKASETREPKAASVLPLERGDERIDGRLRRQIALLRDAHTSGLISKEGYLRQEAQLIKELLGSVR